MSLLNIHHCPFPRVLSSLTSPPSRPSASSTSHGKELQKQSERTFSLEWDVWPNGLPSSKDLLWAQVLQLLQLHGHSAHADPSHRLPPRYPELGRRHRDLHHWPRRFAALTSIVCRTHEHPAAAKQQQAEFLQRQMADHVSSRPGLQETAAISDRESVATIFSSQSIGKRARDTNVVHSLKDRENHQMILKRKVDLAVQGEMMLQRTLYEAEDEVEARNWEKRNSDFGDAGDQSRIWISAISTTPSKSMGRPGSKR